MPAGIPTSSDQAGAGSSNAMAVQELLDPDPDDSTNDGRKAKRELSQSKRAAQNRAAQRAFRQRKEHYIKKLEQQVREYGEMEHGYKHVQNENYGLREYILLLQSRLIDMQVDVPQPSPNLNIRTPAFASRNAPNAPEPPPSTTSAGSLADVAAAVAGLRAREPSADGLYPRQSFQVGLEDNRQSSDEEIPRQLQREPLPPPSSLRA